MAMVDDTTDEAVFIEASQQYEDERNTSKLGNQKCVKRLTKYRKQVYLLEPMKHRLGSECMVFVGYGEKKRGS